MSAPAGLSVLYGESQLPPWPGETERELREHLEVLLRDHEHVLVLGFRRQADGVYDTDKMHVWRDNRAGSLAFLGALHLYIRELEQRMAEGAP